MTPRGERKLRFAAEKRANHPDGAPWKVLIADDDPSVHAVIKLALSEFSIHGHKLEFHDAFAAREACRIVREEHDIVLVLLDLAMERERSGLEAAALIRETIGDLRVRIVLCTGNLQPVLRAGTMEQLDLSECWRKSDLTARHLAAIVTAAIGHYRAEGGENQPWAALVPIAGPT
jgi:CheY-like chemotaxis protein